MMRALFCIIAMTLCGAAVAEPPPLRNNPFSRPPALLAPDQASATDKPDGAPLLLIATMVSTNRAIANVEGRVLKPGDEVRGYVLRRVFEDRAIFERNGNDVVVHVKPQLEQDHERPTPARRRP